jgi:hypothetical protein
MVCRAVGIPHAIPAAPLNLKPANAATGIDDMMLDAAEQWPWTKEDLPQVAAWLAENETGIDRIVAATNLPQYWLPSPGLLDGKPGMLVPAPVFYCVLPRRPDDKARFRLPVSRVLLWRALWHAGEGRPAAAWRDVTAIRRFARMLARPALSDIVNHGLFSESVLSVDHVADHATRHLLAMPDLPVELLATIRRDLERLGPPVSLFADVHFCRLREVDLAVSLARRAPGGRRGRADLLASVNGFIVSPRHFSGDLPLLTSLDWNIILRRLNGHFDDMESALGQPTHKTRVAALNKVAVALEERVWGRERSTWNAVGDGFLQVCSRWHRSDRLADRLLDEEGSPDICIFLSTDVRLALTKTAAALVAWRADRGPGAPPYPERLDDLVPNYLAAVPLDPFADEPFIYERRGDGYLLASVGADGVYDGGDDVDGWIRGGEWQAVQVQPGDKHDLVVRMPFPPRRGTGP